jgi:predicted XRE-type DNA-binding protein
MHQRINCQQLVLHLLNSGYTTRRLGAEIGLSQPSISRISSGKTQSTSAPALIRLIELSGGEVRLPEELMQQLAKPAASGAAAAS